MTAPVFIFDLDGTLLNEERRMHPRDREILLSRRDLVLIPATGRTLTSAKGSFAENGLWVDVNHSAADDHPERLDELPARGIGAILLPIRK